MKPILFIDFDGTVCHDRYWRSLPEDQRQGVQELLFQEDTKIANDWMRGKYTAEEINRFIANTLKIEYEPLWEIFVRDCETMQVSKITLEKIKSLNARFMTFLITGNMDSFSRFTAPSLKLEDYFDYISNSYHEGMHKTDDDGSLFIKYTNQFNVPIQSCIVIDDSRKVCNIFTSLGGKALRVIPESTMDHHLESVEFLIYFQL